MKRVILITSVGGDIGSSVAKHIKEHYKEDKVIGCDMAEYNQGLEYVDECYAAPRYTDEASYWMFITALCMEQKVTHYLPMSEPEMMIADQNRDFFDDHKIKLLLHPHELLEVALSKYRTAVFLKKCGIGVPETWRNAEDSDFNYPLIVKGEYGCGSKTVRIVRNIQELQHSMGEIPQPIIQEYIGSDDEEYTMTIFSDGTNLESIVFKRKLGYGGMSIFVEYIDSAELNILAENIAKAFHLVGSINVQLRRQNQAFYVIEINPRISSTVGFRYKLGFMDDVWWLRILDGDDIDISYTPPKGTVVGIKVLDERIYKRAPDSNSSENGGGGRGF